MALLVPLGLYYALGVLLVDIRMFRKFKHFGLMCDFFLIVMCGSGGTPPQVYCLDRVAHRLGYVVWIGVHAVLHAATVSQWIRLHAATVRR